MTEEEMAAERERYISELNFTQYRLSQLETTLRERTSKCDREVRMANYLAGALEEREADVKYLAGSWWVRLFGRKQWKEFRRELR